MAVQPIHIEPAPRGGNAARSPSADAPTDLFATLLRGHGQDTDTPVDRAPEPREPVADPAARPEVPTAAPTREPSTSDEDRELPDTAAEALAAWLPGSSVVAAATAPATAGTPSLVPVVPHNTQAIPATPPLPAPAAPTAQAVVGALPLSAPAAPAVPAVPAKSAESATPAIPAMPAAQTGAVSPPPTPAAVASAPLPAVARNANPAPGPALDNSPIGSPDETAPIAGAGRPAADSPGFNPSAATARPAVPTALAHIASLAAVTPGAAIAVAAQQVGDAARAAAPGRTKTPGEPAAPGGNPIARVMTEVTPAAGQPPAPVPAPVPAAVPAANVAPAPDTTIADLATGATAKADGAGLGAAVPPPPGLPGAAPTDQSAAAGGRPALAAPPLPEQLSVQIRKAVHAGADRIDIQLRPAELGRIEVRLQFAQDGRLSATVLADRAETLDLLQRDARALERALQESGLKADSGSLTFNLRGEGRQDFGQALERRAADRPAVANDAAAPDLPDPAAPPALRYLGAIDIRV